MIQHEQFREFIIRPALTTIQMYSTEAEELLIFTLAQESQGCSYLAQVGGPAVGPYMVEPTTYKSILAYINRDMDMRNRAYRTFGYSLPPPIDVLKYNLRFATVIARCFYAMINRPLPKSTEDDMWHYYKTYYNTKDGKATKDEAIANYRKFIGRNVNEKGNEGKERGTSRKDEGKKGI